jgi:hypothetical protein
VSKISEMKLDCIAPVYFAHPLNVYDEPLEFELMCAIVEFFGKGYDGFGLPNIESPNQPHHQLGYKRYEESSPDKSGMDYFYEKVLPFTRSAVCLTYLDGMWGAGVAGEAAWHIRRGNPVWQILPNGVMDLVWGPRFKEALLNSDPSLVLSRYATRQRTWGIGKPYISKIPFEKGHLVECRSDEEYLSFLETIPKL